MDKRINKLLFSVIIIFVLVFVSIPLWDYASTKKGAILAQSNNELKISVELGEIPELMIIEDERVFEYINPTKLSLRNPNDKTKDCELLFLVDKNSTLDYNLLRLSIDDKIYKIKELDKIIDQENYYFVLNTYSINAYSNVEHQIRLWIEEDATNINDDVKLIANFITR